MCQTTGVRWLLALTWLSCTACGSFGAPADNRLCSRDEQCDFQCSRLGECLERGEAISVRLSWTIEGRAPTTSDPSACQGISELVLTFVPDSLREEETSYGPIPCELGSIFYDRMPDWFTSVRLTAMSELGGVYAEDVVAIEGVDMVATVDLRP